MIGKNARAARPQPGSTPDQVLRKLGRVPGVRVTLISAIGEVLTVEYAINGAPKTYHGKRTFNWDLLAEHLQEGWTR